jgi:hypothetical protein
MNGYYDKINVMNYVIVVPFDRMKGTYGINIGVSITRTVRSEV